MNLIKEKIQKTIQEHLLKSSLRDDTVDVLKEKLQKAIEEGWVKPPTGFPSNYTIDCYGDEKGNLIVEIKDKDNQ